MSGLHSRRRWLIAIMLMLLSILNYVDRQALAILATTIQRDLTISDIEYGQVAQAFLFCYAAAYFAVGRIVDRIGPRLAETAFVAWWSVANMLTALASGFGSLVAFRCLLGLGEPGHYAVAAKSVGKWFPPHERGLAVSLYTMGGTLGAAIAAPLVAGVTISYGWRAAFVVTGAVGLLFAAAWWFLYRDPISSNITAAAPVPLRQILRWKGLWLVMLVRMLTDPVWYFYLVWFAKYLQERRDYTLADVGNRLWVVFVAADIGCIMAGVIAGLLIRRGVSPVAARLRVASFCAIILAFGFTVPFVQSADLALALASLFAGCVMAFMTCCVALPLDLFPTSSLGSTQGIIGTGGTLGGMVSTGLVAWAITHHSYEHAFVALSLLHPIAIVLLVFLLPRLLKGTSKS